MQHRIRLASGLVLACFVLVHFANHMLGIVSLDAAETFRAGADRVWGSIAGGIVLYAALAAHFVLALVSLYRRRTLRLPAWELTQIALGLLFVPLVATHVVAMRLAEEVLGVAHEYARTVLFIWSDPTETAKQAALVVVAWIHAVLGVHFWLRLRPAYRRWSHVWAALYALVPVVTLLGFYRAGRAVDLLSPGAIDASMRRFGVALPDYARFVESTTQGFWLAAGACLGATLLARFVRGTVRERRHTFVIEHASGPRLRVALGQTVLEALRAKGIPHASVCGGRARCTTCRIRVIAGHDALPPPGALERAALARIEAEPLVRLACQLRPAGALAIAPLVSPGTALARAGRRGGVAGTERVVTLLFVDLRGSTSIAQARLPYDVLFILNQFFFEMSAALHATRGHYAQFNGDGLMAIYGRDGDIGEGARAALAGAVEMLRRLARLNERLREELAEPLRIGIGVHTGEAIVGTMGPPEVPIFSAIGDNVNLAARLEGLTKSLACTLVVSTATAREAGLDRTAYRTEEVAIRGRHGTFTVVAIDDPDALGSSLVI